MNNSNGNGYARPYNDLNKVEITGRLGRDPELRYLSSGKPVASASVAITEQYTDRNGELQKKTHWVDLSIFGEKAELFASTFASGHRVHVQGKLQVRSWETTDGQKRSKVEIMAFEVSVPGRKNESPSAESADEPVLPYEGKRTEYAEQSAG